MGDVVRTVGQTVVAAVAGALAEHETVGQSTGSRGDVHGATASKVVGGQIEEPAVAVPGPVGNGVVNNGRPDEHENNGREHAAPISNGTNGKSRTGRVVSLLLCSRTKKNPKTGLPCYSRNRRKHALVETEQDVREVSRAIGLSNRLHETKLGEVSEEGVSSAGKGQRVAPEEPLEADDRHGHHGKEDERKG